MPKTTRERFILAQFQSFKFMVAWPQWFFDCGDTVHHGGVYMVEQVVQLIKAGKKRD
jgi:hypothetical protein